MESSAQVKVSSSPILRIRGLEAAFENRRILHGVDLDLKLRGILGVVGPSGAGKTTLVRALCGLAPMTSGRIFLEGREVVRKGKGDWKALRRKVQPLFQDPGTALNPRKTVAAHLADPFRVLGRKPGRMELEAAALRAGLPLDLLDRKPGGLSGGERQRAALARVLAVEPRVLLLDEPFSALDPPLREELGDLVQDLARKEGKALLLVSHDLGDLLALADQVLVLGWGRFLEIGPVRDLVEAPLHPWTAALVRAFRSPAEPPPPWTLLPPAREGCPFHEGCPWAEKVCAREEPVLEGRRGGRKVACWRAGPEPG